MLGYYASLWLLTSNFPSGTPPIQTTVEVMQEVTQVALTEDPIPFSDDEHENRFKTAAVLIAWEWGEGGYRVDPGGSACGVGQMYPVAGEPSCVELRSSRVVSAKAMVRRMRKDVIECGGVGLGLGRYASGHCGWARGLVKMRLRWIGVEYGKED